MSTYVTTNVRLPADMLKALKRRAVEENTSVAEIVRASVASYLTQSEAHPIDYEHDPFLTLGQALADGPADGAEQHDRYIYGSSADQPR